MYMSLYLKQIFRRETDEQPAVTDLLNEFLIHLSREAETVDMAKDYDNKIFFEICSERNV